MGTLGSYLGPHEHRGPCLSMYVMYDMLFLNTDFVGSTNTIYRLILSTIYIFIPVSGCVGRGPSAPFCPGAHTTSILHTFCHKCIDNERPTSPEKLENESSEVASML